MALLLLNFNRSTFFDNIYTQSLIESNYNMSKYNQYYQPLENAIQYANKKKLKIIWISNGNLMYTGLIASSHLFIDVKDANIFDNIELIKIFKEHNITDIYIGGLFQNNIKISYFENTEDYQIKILQDLIFFNKQNSTIIDIHKINKITTLNNCFITTTNILLNKWGCNDTYLIDLNLNDDTYDELKKQVHFSTMISQGNEVPRLISIQYIKPENDLFLRPIYRHPNDIEPENVEMCDIVKKILNEVEHQTKIKGFNHVLIQLYRDGSDNISAHSDKTLDIDLNTPIVNVSIGAKREMTIELKDNKLIKQQIPLVNNTALIFGLKTNTKWKHEIKKNMNEPVGERISLTFRKINTFILKDINLIENERNTFILKDMNILIGQGSPYKTLDDIDKIEITDGMINKELLINAFTVENKESDFDWNFVYGTGFLIY